MASMERDYYYPKLADRDEPIVWQEAGALDHWHRAKVKVEQLLQQQPVAEKMLALKLEYLIWLDGSTVRTEGAGSMACSFNGCFGFGTWGHDANYEATIWDFTDQAEVGQVNTSASGQSYMPAVIIPIPIIAPVQGAACDGIGDQLLEFLSSKY